MSGANSEHKVILECLETVNGLNHSSRKWQSERDILQLHEEQANTARRLAASESALAVAHQVPASQHDLPSTTRQLLTLCA